MLQKSFFQRKPTRTFDFDLQARFPAVDDLIAQAQRCTDSCVHVDQLHINREFFRNVAIRGASQRRYSIDDARRVSIILDYITRTRAQSLQRTGTAI